MTIVTRTVAKSYFETGDKPTQSQFSDLIDSTLFYEDTSDFGRALISASAAASTRTLLGSGVVGDKVFTAITTASAQQNIGGGTIGRRIFEAITTASALTELGGGAVGINVFSAITTDSAQDQLGGGTVGKYLFGVNTTASAQDQLGLHEGLSIQVVNFQTGAVATGTTLIPNDDTIPQNTEGDQYMTLSITPTDVSNVLFIEVVVIVSNSVIGTVVTAALFQDNIANALAAAQDTFAQDYTHTINFKYKMTAGTISSTTFKVRIGGDQVSTNTFNGKNAARKLGGILASSITITEVKA